MQEAKSANRDSAGVRVMGPSAAGAAAFDLDHYLKERAALVERALAAGVAASEGPAGRLLEAMRYSLMAGGKRLRPVLALASCEAVGGTVEAAMDLACAIEMIHTYSLVHDDLPCMDDDDLRRGRPTNHKVYGEAIATLAGDALLTDAFKVGGQVIDLLGEGRSMDLGELEHLHSRKTGALFVAAVCGGARLGGATPSQLAALREYAQALGLAFQVIDDLLDVEASTEAVGKRTNKDQARGKATYPSLLGIERSRELARELIGTAQAALTAFDHRADPLRMLAAFAVERKL
jgi:geranylgeranyl diphosphate synthase type II